MIKKKNHISFLLLMGMICGLFYSSALAEEELPTDYTVAMVWMALDPSARAGSMGRAYTSTVNDVTATYWNPAALGFLNKPEIHITHEPRGMESNSEMFFDYVAAVYPTSLGSFAMSLQYHDMGTSERTDEQGNPLGTMHSYGVNPWVSYGKAINENLAVGASAKYAYEHLYSGEGGSSNAFCFDAGAQYRFSRYLHAAIALTNVGPTVAGSPLARTLRIGLSSNVLKDNFNDLTLSTDVHKVLVNLDDSFSKELAQSAFCGGAEYFYFNLVGIRAGYYYLKYGNIMGLTFGAGVRYAGFSFDYASIPEGSFGEENRFSLSYRLP